MPENTLKFAVGVMLTTFGIFWSAERCRGALAGRRRIARRRVLAFVVALSFASVTMLSAQAASRSHEARLRAFGRFWWDFVVGDDWRAAAGIVIAIGLTAGLVAEASDAWWLMPIAVAAILWLSLRRARD